MLHIQKIATEWDKSQRGAKDAALRNSMPEALPADNLLHFVLTENEPLYKLAKHCSFLRNGDQLTIRWHEEAGSFAKKMIVLEPQQWVRLICRSRYPTETSWRFQKLVLNIFWGDTSMLPLNYFSSTLPKDSILKELDGEYVALY